jgi:hypothetical protein
MIRFSATPFPIITVQSALSDDALREVKDEANALWTAHLFVQETGNAVDGDGQSLKTGTGVFLDGLYADRSRSAIIRNTEELLRSELWDEAQSDWFLTPTFRHSNFHGTLLNAYLPNQEYKAHQDQSRISVILCLSGSGDTYDGGDLVFPDYGVTVPNADNQVIVFPSVVRHQVTPIVCQSTSDPVRYSVALFIDNRTG